MSLPVAMRRRCLLLAVAAALAAGTGNGRANPRNKRPLVAATTSDLASLVAAVGGDLVETRTIVPAQADAEAYEPRASDLAVLADAALIVRVGLGYDFWLEQLLARGPQPRADGSLVDASAGVPLLEVKGRDPFAGDGHAHGMANPHYWLDPANAETITASIAAAIVRLAPEVLDEVLARRRRFVEQLHARMDTWSRQLAPFRGAAVFAYHNSWPYFARRFRLNIVGILERKEGVAPSAAHLSSLIAQARRGNVRAILQRTGEPKQFSQMLSARTGVPLVLLAAGVGSVPQAQDYLGLMDYNVRALADALGAGAVERQRP
jgi:ABC-type Zn uptake system ZnuABC Zn-binding protein ZnuA